MDPVLRTVKAPVEAPRPQIGIPRLGFPDHRRRHVLALPEDPVVQDELMLVLDESAGHSQFHRRARLALQNPARVLLEDREHLLRVRNRLAPQESAFDLADLAPGMNDQAFDGFTGHALFPHATADPTTIAGQSAGLDTGAGLTAALGYTFRGGFSAEVEWGFQQVGIGNPDENFSLSAGGFFLGIPSIRGIPSIGTVGGILDDEGSVDNFLPFSFQIDGEIQIQSLMANLSYRHPAWRRRPVPFVYNSGEHDRR